MDLSHTNRHLRLQGVCQEFLHHSSRNIHFPMKRGYKSNLLHGEYPHKIQNNLPHQMTHHPAHKNNFGDSK